MGKEVSNSIIVEFRFNREGEIWTVKGYVEYGVKITEYSEFGEQRKSVSLILTPSEETQIISFAKKVIASQLNTDLPIKSILL